MTPTEHDAAVEAVARAITEADASFGYSFNLTRLVDGEATHTLSMPGFDPIDFIDDRDEGYQLIEQRRNLVRASAVCAALFATRAENAPVAASQEEQIDQLARRLYAASCKLDPVEEREPDWGRGGYKTEVMYWHGLARASLSTASVPRNPESPMRDNNVASGQLQSAYDASKRLNTTKPLAPAASEEVARLREENAALRSDIATVLAHFNAKGNGRDAPGHCHDVAGKWDADNAPEIAGTTCGWCAQWSGIRARAALSATDREFRIVAASEEVVRLREALQAIIDGDVPRTDGVKWRSDGAYSKNDRCSHGIPMYEDCSECTATFARAALDPQKGEE